MKWFKYVIVIIGLSTFAAKEAKAQVDTVFWFAAPWVTPDHADNVPMAFHFSTFANATTVRLRQPAATYDTTFTIAPNTLFTKYVSHLLDSLESKPADSVVNWGFEVTTDFPIVTVYDFQSSGNNPETYSLKGQNGMGYEFVAPFQTLWNNKALPNDRNGDGVITEPKQYFSVVATEDNTTIYITPKCDVEGGHPANVTYSVFLANAGQVYTCQNVTQLTSVLGQNLAGSIIVSDKRVSVTVNDDSVNPSGGGGCYDLMGDQIVPTDVIGREYIVNKGFLNAGSDESVFIVGTENFTSLSIDNGLTVTTATINQGDIYQYSITEQLTYINADKNVYVLHMSGYGCELGEALLPPLNCAGSDQVSYARSNGFSFLLDILCPAGAEGNFLMDGNATMIQATDFSPVPGTGGAWMGAQIPFTTAQVPVGSAPLVENTSDLFSLGIINGSATGGCLYHYLSQFNRKVYTDAGKDTTLCNGESTVNLTGSVTGGTITGEWQVLNGSGTLNTPTNLTTTYLPTTSDYTQGSLTFVLGSTGNCEPVYDTIVVNFIQSPVVTTTGDGSYCKNNIGAIPISGTVTYAAGASWTGGSGGAFGNAGDLSTTYTPSPADLAADSVALFLTSAGSFFACPNDQDTVVVHFTDPPGVVAGPDLVVCSSEDSFSLNGLITGVTSTGIWTTTGSGAFDPGNTDLLGDYLISSADTAAGAFTVYLTSTNNSNCQAVVDSFEVAIIDKPTLAIGTSDSLCSNLSTINLTGSVTAGFATDWDVLGAGSIADETSLNTIYTLSPVDTTSGFIDIVLQTTGSICPVESDTLTITFVNPPTVTAGLDQSFCENEPIQLNGIVSGAAPIGSWASTGTGTFNPSNALLSTIYFPSPGDVASGGIDLILTSSGSFGCIPDNDTLEVTFIPPPTVDFSFTNACAGENTNFLDLSTTTDGTINTWTWDFGDMSGSIANNPIHPYPAPGSYTTTLIAGSTNGCSDTVAYVVDVNPVPIAIISSDVACAGQETMFEDQSFISSGTIVDWEWDFENGVHIDNSQEPTYTFAIQGSYPVSLTVTSDLGCTGTTDTNIVVLQGPVADFSIAPNPALALEDVNFTDESTGNVTLWYWDFGDGVGGNNQNEVYSYADGGDYTVTLTVTDNNGCYDSTAQEINIALLPVLPTAFSPNGDGENDEFIIRGGPFTAVDFKVYSNWGELIFSSTDPAIGWDGTWKGQNAPLGVYTWTFVVEIAGNRIVTKSGDVTLMR
jgi:gliding motility-associated-like protein